ncbi:MFS transporter [Cellulomonas iranensis]|uniref:MFS transporter n=1 Tax=Cellulomonas iranensis TaxID=76862 RepID=UPI003C6C1F11
MGHDLELAPGAVGWVVAAGQLGYLAGLVLLVPLGDVLDSRRLVAAHLLALSAGLGLVAASSAAWVAFVGLALAGLAAVVVQTAVAYAARLTATADRGRSIGVVTSGVVVGILGSRVVAGLVADVGGWRAVYVVLAAACLVLALVVPRVLPPDPRGARPRYGAALRGLGSAFRDPVLRSRGAVAFFLFASFGTLWSGLAVPLAGAPWHLGENRRRAVRRRRPRRRPRRGTRGPLGRPRPRGPRHRRRPRAPARVVGADRAAAALAAPAGARRGAARPRGPGGPRQQPARPHRRPRRRDGDRRRRVHGLLLARLRARRHGHRRRPRRRGLGRCGRPRRGVRGAGPAGLGAGSPGAPLGPTGARGDGEGGPGGA